MSNDFPEANAPGMAESASQSTSASSSVIKDAVRAAQGVAGTAAWTVAGEAKQLLNKQLLTRGAGFVGNIAKSIDAAARDLDSNSPQLGGLARNLASQVRSYESELRDASVDDVARTAIVFTRRNPALVFGLTALAGFLAMRVFKSMPEKLTSTSVAATYKRTQPAFRESVHTPEDWEKTTGVPTPVRPAGPKDMRDPPKKWDGVDQQLDESFPASDPPGNY